MLVEGILEEIYITRGVTPFHLQTVPLETKYYWSGSAAIKKRCKAPRGRWIHTIVLDTVALANILSFCSMCKKLLQIVVKLFKITLELPVCLSKMLKKNFFKLPRCFCKKKNEITKMFVQKTFEIATVFVGEMRVL